MDKRIIPIVLSTVAFCLIFFTDSIQMQIMLAVGSIVNYISFCSITIEMKIAEINK